MTPIYLMDCLRYKKLWSYTQRYTCSKKCCLMFNFVEECEKKKVTLNKGRWNKITIWLVNDRIDRSTMIRRYQLKVQTVVAYNIPCIMYSYSPTYVAALTKCVLLWGTWGYIWSEVCWGLKASIERGEGGFRGRTTNRCPGNDGTRLP